MANSIFKTVNSQNRNPQQMQPFNDNGFSHMMQMFNQFRSNFRGDPKEQVQQLLSSGRMSQDMYNQLSNIATQFMQFIR